MRLHVRTDNASWLAIGCFYMQTYGARRKREGAAARRIRAAAWLNGAGAHGLQAGRSLKSGTQDKNDRSGPGRNPS